MIVLGPHGMQLGAPASGRHRPCFDDMASASISSYRLAAQVLVGDGQPEKSDRSGDLSLAHSPGTVAGFQAWL